ncbi:MAG: DUF1257 domain-containing protein [Planctomycetes bacterium]|nr:DUF1257 domain-containing protein [Planctomycetota bacterium]
MSTVVILAPIVIANWPVIAAAVGAAVGTLGFAMTRTAGSTAEHAATTREELEVENSEILPAMAGEEERIVVEREGVRAIFTRDARGALRVCMEGTGQSRSELRRLGQELIDRVTQQYVYHRVVTELKARNMTIVDEEVAEDRTVKIRVRGW